MLRISVSDGRGLICHCQSIDTSAYIGAVDGRSVPAALAYGDCTGSYAPGDFGRYSDDSSVVKHLCHIPVGYASGRSVGRIYPQGGRVQLF